MRLGQARTTPSARFMSGGKAVDPWSLHILITGTTDFNEQKQKEEQRAEVVR